ncbi:MAG TPA: CoA transferase [Thermoplasmata archaeon]|nr:CoA transferase [Thermoplasmata archaeon]
MLPLKNIKILDLSWYIPGPYCSMLLSDFGAEVIKIEPKTGDPSRRIPPFIEGEGAMFIALNRNKKSLALNLKAAEGKEIFYKLASKADVILESFRPGVTERLGIDYDGVSKINKKIIYCSISSYGQKGPLSDEIAHNVNSLARGGMIGSKAPCIPGAPVADLASGMFSALAILIAVIGRSKTGKGEYIDISMLDSVVSWMTPHLIGFFADEKAERSESSLVGEPLSYGVFKAKDGYFTLGIIEPKFWLTFCKAIGREDLINDQFARGKRREEATKILNSVFSQKTREEWTGLLKQLPCAPVNRLDEIPSNPQLNYRKMFFEIGGIRQIANPINFSEFRQKVNKPPKIGENSEEILIDLGYDNRKINFLKNKGYV